MTTAERTTGAAGPSLPRILIVDDEEAVQDVLREYFDDQGYAVETAPNAVAALAAVRERLPDVVMLDLNLPGAMVGLEVLGALAARCPVIVITANTDDQVGHETLRLGAFDYVSKPFDFAYLDLAVQAALACYAPRRDEPGPPGGDLRSQI